MGQQFTRERAMEWSDRVSKGYHTNVAVYTDGLNVTLTSGGATNVLTGYTLINGFQFEKSSVVRLNPKHFENSSGKVVKSHLADFLYKEVNNLIGSHSKAVAKAYYKKLHKRVQSENQAPTNTSNQKNTHVGVTSEDGSVEV